jgi:hypothetical protein
LQGTALSAVIVISGVSIRLRPLSRKLSLAHYKWKVLTQRKCEHHSRLGRVPLTLRSPWNEPHARVSCPPGLPPTSRNPPWRWAAYSPHRLDLSLEI